MGADDARLVGVRDVDGFTALHVAASKGRVDCLVVLLKFGSAINAPVWVDGRAKTPLDVAVGAQQEQVVTYLREKGALSMDAVKRDAATVIQVRPSFPPLRSQRYWRAYKERRHRRVVLRARRLV